MISFTALFPGKPVDEAQYKLPFTHIVVLEEAVPRVLKKKSDEYQKDPESPFLQDRKDHAGDDRRYAYDMQQKIEVIQVP
jgi:hypothetical protein